MKKMFYNVSTLVLLVLIGTAAIDLPDPEGPVFIPASKQRVGDAEKGYEYLLTGDYIRSGIPFSLFGMGIPKGKDDLKRTGKNAGLPYDYTAIKSPNGEWIVAPNCLQCHAQVFDGQVIVGMGNSFSDYTQNRASLALITENMLKQGKGADSVRYQAAKPFLTTIKTIAPHLVTPKQGVNLADALAALLVAHRDPKTLRWTDKPILDLPQEIVPTDVPAWWLLRKKNAMFYNGFGRGDFARFLMASNLLTVSDTAEAKDVDQHFPDVLAYIYSIRPPKFPKPIDQPLAAKGSAIFKQHCSTCHGTYGKNESYPNLLIPASIIQTDSLLSTSNYSSPQFVNWFNQSWFTSGDHPAKLEPFRGYIAPPLDGVWATAPYLHNGSVPDLETLLNSKKRPTHWKRDFNQPSYQYDIPGWTWEAKESPGDKSVYNTTLPGYRNVGHYFGDRLSNSERRAVIEYLKTL
jgi:mono/diheme cytochrome c family protein